MASPDFPMVLGSRSPRRRELLQSVAAGRDVVCLPPLDANEAGFAGLLTETDIERQLRGIVAAKHADVNRQVETRSIRNAMILVADTVVVAAPDDGRRIVLGQPGPENWQQDVRTWFRSLLSGRSHSVWTCFRITSSTGTREAVVRSEVTFAELSDDLIEWYIRTGESVGKAGGYAIQGHAAIFVTALRGSLTNVIGLPLQEVAMSMTELGTRPFAVAS